MASGVAARETEGLLACVHCGFCLPACPTYRVLGEENDSPRGRVHLMRAAIDGRLGAAGAYAYHLGRCLGCRACEPACPAGVPYGSLLELARARIPSRRAARRVQSLVLWALTGEAASRIAYAIGRLLRSTGVAALAARVLPGRAGLAAELLNSTRPVRIPSAAARGGTGAPSGPPGPESPGRPRPESPRPESPKSQSVPAAPEQAAQRTYTLLEGCVMRGLFRHVHAATRRVLALTGLEERAAPGQACCGALHAHAGRLAEAATLARRNIEAFERSGARWVVVDSAGCGASLRDYPRWLSDDPEWASRASHLADRVRDVSELAGTGAPVGRLAGRVAYDAPCHLLHAQGVREEPQAMLRGIEDLTLEPLPSAERCCGGAGLYNLSHPSLAWRVLEPKLDEIRSGRFDWVATGNPGCIMYIGVGLRRAGVTAGVVHPVELVAAAAGRGEERAGGAGV